MSPTVRPPCMRTRLLLLLRSIMLVGLATHFLVGGCFNPPPPAPPSVIAVDKAFKTFTDQQVVTIADDNPTVYILTDVKDVLPVGHPLISTDDCVANPTSQGCRIQNVHALAQAQSVTADKLCMSDRVDLYFQRDDVPPEVIGGLPFDPNWLLRMPAADIEAAYDRWPGGITYRLGMDVAWVQANEPACCNDGTPGNCQPTDQCLVPYGLGNDVTQVFKVTGVGADLRNAAYRAWSADRLVEKAYDTDADCVVIGFKPGWWMAINNANGNDECNVTGSPSWVGPTPTFDPCAAEGGILANTPYAVGEYQNGQNDALREIFAALDSSGLTTFDIVMIEKPRSRGANWSWMDNDVRNNPHMVGEWTGSISPTFPGGGSGGSGSVAVYLTPPPFPGAAPFVTDLDADVRGSATGPIDYHLWCDCASSSADVATAQTACGTAPGNYHFVSASNNTHHIEPAACSYTSNGSYTVKALVVRDTLTDEDRITLDVGADPWPLP